MASTGPGARPHDTVAYDEGMPRPRRSLEEEVVIVRSLVWFVLGIAGGFVAAHLVNKDPRGQELLAQVDARISEFTDRMSEAYHAQETRLSDVLDDAKTVAATAADTVADAAATVAAAAKKAAPTD